MDDGNVINVDPDILLDNADEINDLIDANAMIIKTVRSLLKKCIDSGVDKEMTSRIVVALQNYAAGKARELIPYDETDSQKRV